MKIIEVLVFLASLGLLTSCAPGKFLKRADLKSLNELLGAEDLDHHMGFLLKDISTGTTLEDHHSNRYYTPASNTKILTLALGMEILEDSIPFVAYYIEGDTLYIRGMGDPTFLHPDFQSEKLLEFLKQKNHLVVDLSNFKDERYGSGWSWDDYNGAYQIERSALPIYGNKIEFVDAHPGLDLFKDAVDYQPSPDRLNVRREIHSNYFKITGKSGEEIEKSVPLKILDKLICRMLQDTLNVNVKLGNFDSAKSKGIRFSHPVDSLFRPMMEESDNFFADQIVMMTSQKMLGEMNESAIIKEAKSTFLESIDEHLWYDGSGLSRYNQLTPRAIVHVLQNLESKFGLDRLRDIFPKGGSTGTIKDWYGGRDGGSFVFAKTGTMRNVHCLSGYFQAKSGKWFVFSFMHNNFPGGSSTVKEPMERILYFLQDAL